MMSTIRSIFHLALADSRERIRQYRFLLILGASVYAGYLFMPPIGASYTAFVIHGHRGFYNSPWVGLVFGVVVSLLLTLIGFYLVKGSIKRDYETRVGQIIATTPIRGSVYVFGKWLSNLAVFGLILAVLTVVAGIMQIVRGENTNFELWSLIAPIWLMGVPTLAAVAAMAVLFESIFFLRGGLGNVVYFFVWFGMLMILAGMMFIYVEDITPRNDFAGVSRAIVDIRRQMAVEGLDIHQGSTDLFVPTRGREVLRITWGGIDWTVKMLFERMLWLSIAAILALAASIPFDRFDPACRRVRHREKKRERFYTGTWRKLVSFASLPIPGKCNPSVLHRSNISPPSMALDRHHLRQRFLPLLRAELILMAKSQRWWWHGVALGLLIAIFLSPLEVAHQYLFPLAWLWPVLLWSSMGSREERYQTYPITFSVAHPIRYQLPAVWLAGVFVACLTGGTIAVQLLLAGQYAAWFSWLVGALFIPTLALALGSWTRSHRWFEIVYVLLWYIGPIKRVSVFDYMGVTSKAITSSVSLYYLAITILLLLLAVIGRQRQIQT